MLLRIKLYYQMLEKINLQNLCFLRHAPEKGLIFFALKDLNKTI